MEIWKEKDNHYESPCITKICSELNALEEEKQACVTMKGMVQSSVGLRTEISMVPGKRKCGVERCEEMIEGKG